MAFASGGSLGTNQEKTSDTSLVLTTTADLTAGEFGVIGLALDNINTTDADHSEITGVVDSAGNTWAKLAEYTNGNGAAASGATVSVWGVVAGSTLASGGTITVTTSANTTAKCIFGHRFTIGAGNDVEVAGSATPVANDGADAASISIAGLSSQEYLWVHVIAIEATQLASSYAEDADYTSFANIGTTGGGGATNMSVYGGYRIMTGTGDTVDVGTAARNSVQVFIALREVSGSIVEPAGQTSETDTAQALGRVKTKAAGLVSETDTALSMSGAKARALGLGSETDAPLALTARKTVMLGLVTETDSALPLGATITVVIGLVSETDTPLTLTARKSLTLGLVSETDAPLALGRLKTLGVGLLTEGDTALALTAQKARALGLVSESDSAQALTHAKRLGLGLVTETDLPLALFFDVVVAIYAVALFANPTPGASLNTNPSPGVDLESNPSPAVSLNSG